MAERPIKARTSNSGPPDGCSGLPETAPHLENEKPPPILDYGTRPPHARLKQWLRWIAWPLLIVFGLYIALLAWIYWDWRQEQSALAQMGAHAVAKRPFGNTIWELRHERRGMEYLIPPGLDWLADRVVWVEFDRTAPVDAKLVHLHRLKCLVSVDLSNTQLTDAGLLHLSSLKELRVLDLSGTQVSDAGLAHLSGLPNLWCLTLDDTQITDSGLVHLKRIPKLSMLELRGTKVTAAGVADLEKAWPHHAKWQKE